VLAVRRSSDKVLAISELDEFLDAALG